MSDLQQLMKDQSYQDTPMYSEARDAQNEMKNLFQSCKKANVKYVMALPEPEVENEMEWLSHFQKLMSNINLQPGKLTQCNQESKSKGLHLELMKIPQSSGDIH